MTNKEKYADKIIDITVSKLALKDGEPVPCAEMRCSECGFYISNYSCKHKMLEWLDSEYVEPPVDWSKVAVDTPILVRDREEDAWRRRYFATYENGIVYAWSGGTTSWSACSSDIGDWKMAKLVENEDVEVEKPQTNADRIRSMTDDELAEWFDTVTKDVLGGSTWNKKGWLEWLREESEGEDAK